MKNLLIEQQVEEADRFLPRPAASHVAWDDGSRRARRLREALQRREQRQLMTTLIGMYVLGLLTAGSIWAIVEVTAWLGSSS